MSLFKSISKALGDVVKVVTYPVTEPIKLVSDLDLKKVGEIAVGFAGVAAAPVTGGMSLALTAGAMGAATSDHAASVAKKQTAAAQDVQDQNTMKQIEAASALQNNSIVPTLAQSTAQSSNGASGQIVLQPINNTQPNAQQAFDLSGALPYIVVGGLVLLIFSMKKGK
jgi:hypothetical protein